ncbi:hypothetical protein [Paraburkholderia sp. MM5477-R1]|uniref:hypothetical protein n=1 Tax=Paraburkholderia sp. MM5477-R1 TaxID=2991062 RepID=UPI003D1E3CA9
MTVRLDAIRHHLAADNDRLREALRLIAEIAEGSTTAGSLPNIARLARNALVSAAAGNTALRQPATDPKEQKADAR